MVSISNLEAAKLRELGLSEDIHMANVTHKSKHKSYYLTESKHALSLLESIRCTKN